MLTGLNRALEIAKKIKKRKRQIVQLEQQVALDAAQKSQLNAYLQEYEELREAQEFESEQVRELIEHLAIGEWEQYFLTLRYVDGKLWRDIEDEIGYSKRYTLQLHANILAKCTHRQWELAPPMAS